MKKIGQCTMSRGSWGPRCQTQGGSSPRAQWLGDTGSNLARPRQAASCRWQALV